MKYAILFIFLSIQLYSTELDLPGWKKEIGNDVQDQKIINFTKLVKSDDNDFKFIIIQTRNGQEWHWTQDFYIKDKESEKYINIAWNIMANDGKNLLRWYTYGNYKNGCIVFGTGEKKDKEGIKENQKYLLLIRDAKSKDILFLDTGNGIFDLYIPKN